MPMCALAQGLRAVGYQPKLITHLEFQGFVEACGFEFAPLAGNYRQFFGSDEGQRFVRGEFLPWMPVPQFQKELPTQLKQVLAAAQGSSAIIAGPLTLWAYHIAECLQIPMAVAACFPIAETRYFPFLGFDEVPSSVNPIQAVLNQSSYRAASLLGWIRDRDIFNEFRQLDCQLPELPYLGPHYRSSQPRLLKRVPILHLYSEAVIPAPPDWAASSHPVQVTGYCFVDPPVTYQPPEELEAFIAGGEPPVAIGFGSMAVQDPQQMTQLLLEAAQLAQVRTLLLAGWGLNETGYLSEQVYAVRSVPHDWLFPRCSAVVHHGGAGTVAAGLRAGVPAVTVPFFGDQPTWGKRLQRLGVAPPPIPIQELTAQKLAAAILQVLKTPSMRQQASTLAASIQAENGVARAADAIRSFVEFMSW
jgi:sterol 3beta-glucosyltransferase